MPATLDTYLTDLATCCADILGDGLIGLYAYGSKGVRDFLPGKSDIDIIGVVAAAISVAQKDALAEKLDHAGLPVPAAGLEFTLVTRANAQKVTGTPSFEFQIATGETWTTEVEHKGGSSELHLTFAIARDYGRVLYGPPAPDIFPAVPRQSLLKAMVDGLDWHRTKILDPFHDPLGQYSVLNAARALRFAEEGILSSKREGGEWLLHREPENQPVRQALDIRGGQSAEPVREMDIDDFLEQVLAVLRSELQAPD